jgi:hypothetical protein
MDVVYEEPRPALAARATGLAFAGYELELQSPTGDGPLASFLERYRPRIRSATWKVESIEGFTEHLAAQGVELVDGDRPGTLAIRPEDNLGIDMQFTP